MNLVGFRTSEKWWDTVRFEWNWTNLRIEVEIVRVLIKCSLNSRKSSKASRILSININNYLFLESMACVLITSVRSCFIKRQAFVERYEFGLFGLNFPLVMKSIFISVVILFFPDDLFVIHRFFHRCYSHWCGCGGWWTSLWYFHDAKMHKFNDDHLMNGRIMENPEYSARD